MPHVLFLTFVLGVPIASCKDPDTFSGYNGKPVENIKSVILVVGGFGNGRDFMGNEREVDLNSSEVIQMEGLNIGCRIPDLSRIPTLGSLIKTPNNEKILLCGAYHGEAATGCQELLWTDEEGYLWTEHSKFEDIDGTPHVIQVTMPDGAYVFVSNLNSDIETTSYYLPRLGTSWEAGPTVPNGDIFGGCMVRISDEEFLVIGGGYRAQIMKYSTRTRSWDEEWGRLIHGRLFHHGCAFVDGKVIVAGGLNVDLNSTNQIVDTTEIIDVSNRQSKPAGNMKERRYATALVTVNGKVLAIGGYNEESGSLSSVEEFDLEEEIWSMASFSMNQGRSRMIGYLVLPEDEICRE